MNRRIFVTALLLAVLLTLIIASSADSKRPFEIPPGHMLNAYECDQWWPEEPRIQKILLDVCYCGWDNSLPQTGPTESQRQAIRDVGGKILYEFNVPYLRAWLPVARVPDLAGYCWTLPVPHPRRYPVEAMIRIPTPLSEQDRAYLESLGAESIYEFGIIPWIFAIVPDSSIPAIRDYEPVTYFEVNFHGCPLGMGRNLPTGDIPVQAGSTTWGRLKSIYR